MTETDAYQLGLADVVRERESLSAIFRAIERTDLQISYVQGWLAGERLLVGKNPLGEFE